MSGTAVWRRQTSLSKVAGYSDEYLAVLAAMTTDPDDTNKGYQNTLVAALKTAGVWSLADVIYVTAVHTNSGGEALVNWYNPGTYNLSAVGSPTFTAYQGFRTNGTSQYFTTGYDQATNGVHVDLNSLTLSVYLRDDNAVSDKVAIGTYNWDPYVETTLFPYMTYVGSCMTGKLNQNQDTPYLYGVVTTAQGLSTIVRRGSAEMEAYKNGTSCATTSNTTTSSLGESSVDIILMATDNAFGTIISYLANQISFAYIGGAISDTQVSDMYSAVQAYMTSIGYQV